MLGGVVFVICFVLFLLISQVMGIPPGDLIVQQFIPDILGTGYASWAVGIINGVVYGVIIWVIFSLVKSVYDRREGTKKIVIETDTKK